eukprot:CAMPEP_0115313760 /NCGR_PEP_ID=MMETSP0270-20121206/76650_1 /TAXON_ID=71861 /ORGANISM="Scrippsiella trochoidea, Strain CCMP3099" /LENGTH=64 /DNA_ID=CAMNT_0002732899 /DNA_START=238 /DNA_END=429 /DNA_ORIENTATION=-
MPAQRTTRGLYNRSASSKVKLPSAGCGLERSDANEGHEMASSSSTDRAPILLDLAGTTAATRTS